MICCIFLTVHQHLLSLFNAENVTLMIYAKIIWLQVSIAVK